MFQIVYHAKFCCIILKLCNFMFTFVGEGIWLLRFMVEFKIYDVGLLIKSCQDDYVLIYSKIVVIMCWFIFEKLSECDNHVWQDSWVVNLKMWWLCVGLFLKSCRNVIMCCATFELSECDRYRMWYMCLVECLNQYMQFCF